MDDDYELRPSSPDNMSMMELSDGDGRIWCDRCNCTLVDEWWHCDLCDDYDICNSCVEKKLRCKDDSHDLTKWMGNVYYGNGIIGPGPTDMMLPGNSNRWDVVEDTHPTANDGWGSVDDSMGGVWGDVDSSTNWGSVEPTTTPPDAPNPEATSLSSDHLSIINEVLLPSASDTTPTTKREHSAMSDNPTTTAPAAPTASSHHFTSIRAARAYLNASVARWTPPSAPTDASNIPTTPSAEWAYVHAAIHSVTVGLKHMPLGEHMLQVSGMDDIERARLLEARAWLLFDALKQLHDGGCVLPPDIDFSNDFDGDLGDRLLGFRQRWVEVCKMLQKFSSAAEKVASGTDEEILEVYVAAPLAMGMMLEDEKERKERENKRWSEESEERERKKLKTLQSVDTD